MVKLTRFASLKGTYIAPGCDVLDINIASAILETSLTSGSIDDGTIEDWGTL